jgi:hemolysin activation/secretion protein
VAKGWDVGQRAQLRTSASYSGRYASRNEQQFSDLSATYFGRQELGFTLFASLKGQMVRNPDAPNSLQLGGDEDLRGYPLRYQSGDKTLVLRIEERMYTDLNVFRLIRVGAAAFYDGGRAWGGSIPNTANAGWLSDVGFGLRFLTDRSSKSNVLHLDVAFPLNRDPTIDRVQFLVYTLQSL